MEKLVSLPKVYTSFFLDDKENLLFFLKASKKNIEQTPSKPDGGGRLGHFIKKRTKDHKKLPPSTDEAIQMSEQEHNDMLKVAKVSLYYKNIKINILF